MKLRKSWTSNLFSSSKTENCIHLVELGMLLLDEQWILLSLISIYLRKKSPSANCKLHVYVLRTLHDFYNKCNQWQAAWMSRILVARSTFKLCNGHKKRDENRRVQLKLWKFMSAWVKKCNNHYYRLPFPYNNHLRSQHSSSLLYTICCLFLLLCRSYGAAMKYFQISDLAQIKTRQGNRVRGEEKM